MPGKTQQCAFIFLSSFIAALILGSTSSAKISQPRIELSGLKFTTELYSLLRQDKAGGDVFFSPMSISTALIMLNEGARGTSTTQIRSALGLSSDDQKIRGSFKSIVDRIQNNKGNVTLDLAVKLYANANDFRLNQTFNDTLVKEYNAEIDVLDFSNSGAAVNQINDWVEKVTHDKIQDLMPPGSVNEETKLVLANAVYFKGEWAQKFEKAVTTKGNFHVSPLQTITVDMMRIMDDFFVVEMEDAYAIDLPYEGEKVFLTIVVPKERDGLLDIENKLNDTLLHEYLWGGRRRSRRVRLMMPKFKIESSFGLRKFLPEIGISDVFNPSSADLSGISSDPLFVDEGFHKAFIEVNEEGAEAAAATVLTLVPLSAILDFSQPLEINVDQPSLIAIKHKDIQEPIFFGRLSAPGIHDKKTPGKSAPRTPAIPARVDGKKPN